MDNSNPTTLSEWQSYIAGLDPDQLPAKADAANQIAFVRSLEEDGLTASEIEGVFVAFAEAFAAHDLLPPGRGEGGYLDYGMLLSDPRLQVVGDDFD